MSFDFQERRDSPKSASPISMRFSYQDGAFDRIVIPGSVGATLGLLIFGFGLYKFFEGGWVMVPLGAMAVHFSCKTIFYYYNRTRPIEISANYIAAVSIFGKKKSINWSAVQKVEKLRLYCHEEGGWRYGSEIVITSETEFVCFSDKIIEFANLVNNINHISKKTPLRMLSRDLGNDTKELILKNSKNSKERRRLLKNGVVASISEL